MSELDGVPYRLADLDSHQQAKELLLMLLPKTGVLGVEPLLTVLANIQANEQILSKTTTVAHSAVPAAKAQCLERL